MTTHTHPTTGRPVTPRAAGHHLIIRDHTVTGTATQLANIVANHRNAGTLIAMTAPRPVTGDRLQVVIRIRELRSSRPPVRVTSVGAHATMRAVRSRRRRRVPVITAVVGAAAGLLAVTAYLVGQLVELIAAHAGLILGVLALAALLAGRTARRGSGRRHCPGC
jgi:hypothetical protein